MSKEYENQNVSYVIHGNYHLPCITVKEQNELHIGVWANRHRQYLKQHHRIRYDEIAEATENLDTVQTQIKAIKEQKISQKRIFEFLELFDIIYNEFTEFEKKEFLHSFIKKIEIYPEPLENGQILKSIQFRFPVYYQGNEADMFIPNFENTVETVVLMSRISGV